MTDNIVRQCEWVQGQGGTELADGAGGLPPLAAAIAAEWARIGVADSLDGHREWLAAEAGPGIILPDSQAGRAVRAYWLHAAVDAIASGTAPVIAIPPRQAAQGAERLRKDSVSIPDGPWPEPPVAWVEMRPYGAAARERIGWLLMRRNIGLVGVPFELEKRGIHVPLHAVVLPVREDVPALAAGPLERLHVFELDASGWLGARERFLYFEVRYLELLLSLGVIGGGARSG